MKKVPFNYDYFKANPDTKLVCRDEKLEPPHFIGARKDFKLFLFEDEDTTIYHVDKDGFMNKNYPCPKDICMLVPSKEEEVLYANEYPTWVGYTNDSINDCKGLQCYGALRIVKLVKVDGLIDFTRTEVVHEYKKS